jgi:hypothetical protein
MVDLLKNIEDILLNYNMIESSEGAYFFRIMKNLKTAKKRDKFYQICPNLY